MPTDTIMDMVDNIEGLYNAKLALFDRWLAMGDAWTEPVAHRQAHALAREFAEALRTGYQTGRYRLSDTQEAADEMLAEFDDYREEAIRIAMEQAKRVPKPEELEMTPGEIEHAEKYEALAQKIGIEELRQLIPASPERVRQVLARGDKHLNMIPLRLWDAAVAGIPERLSLGEKVSLLKHVAKWHYA